MLLPVLKSKRKESAAPRTFEPLERAAVFHARKQRSFQQILQFLVGPCTHGREPQVTYPVPGPQGKVGSNDEEGNASQALLTRITKEPLYSRPETLREVAFTPIRTFTDDGELRTFDLTNGRCHHVKVRRMMISSHSKRARKHSGERGTRRDDQPSPPRLP